MQHALGRFWLLLYLTFCLTASVLAQVDKTYVLDSEDVVTIAILGHPQLSGDYLVPDAGIILLPVVGDLKVAGMSLTQVRDIVTEKMKVRLIHPEVLVNVKTPRSKKIFIYGDVKNPGMVAMTEGWRIQEALSAAGGLAAGVQAEEALLIMEKKSGDRRSFRLSDLLASPLSDQPLVEPGDVLRFQTEYLVSVFITGAVKTPALYSLKQSRAGVLEAIAQAGGLAEHADMRSVKVIRSGGEEFTVDITRAMLRGEGDGLPRLKAGDVVVVSESLDRVWVLGYVARPGSFFLPQSEILTLSQVITLAGGSSARGRLSRVGLIRIENGKESRTVYDLGRFLMKGDTSQNPSIKPSDILYVPETNKVDIASLLGAIGAVRLILGGF